MTQETFTFDDMGFGWSNNGNKSITRRGLSIPEQLAGAQHRRTWYMLAGEITRLVREGEKAKSDVFNENHHFEMCMSFTNWLIGEGRMLTPHSEEADGALAPALNWITSVKAIQADLATANRTILELRRVNAEQRLQEQRLDEALRRAALAAPAQADLATMASALKDIVNAADNGQPYTWPN